jgi:hypothetical protein
MALRDWRVRFYISPCCYLTRKQGMDCWRDLFRLELRFVIHIRVFAYYHSVIWIQSVLTVALILGMTRLNIPGDARAQLFTIPPYAVSAAVLVIFSFVSDKLQTRGIPISIACTISAIGYLYDPQF